MIIEPTEIIADYCLGFNNQYLLGSDGHIYRLPFEYKGKFYGMKKLKPQYRGKNKASVGWDIQMKLNSKAQFWYKAQLMTQFVKMEKPIIIKSVELNENYYNR
jgi:hypothetical protein